MKTIKLTEVKTIIDDVFEKAYIKYTFENNCTPFNTEEENFELFQDYQNIMSHFNEEDSHYFVEDEVFEYIDLKYNEATANKYAVAGIYYEIFSEILESF